MDHLGRLLSLGLATGDSGRVDRRELQGRPAPPTDMARLQSSIRAFTEERDWSQFHTPKNLAMALAAEPPS